MGGKLGGTKGGPMADINVTPLIDVVLVLLVVFMVITPLLQSGLPVDLPVATQTTTVNDAGQFIVISITVNEGWWIEQERTDEDTLISMVNDEFQDNPRLADGTLRTILIKADRNLPYKDVREVMDLLAENKWTSLLIAAGKEK